ncbi:hypothetical protein Q3G72_032236 [Acer saccharum]|nr:hypothetical protein Q3G72_032236 [Acer saccharum]
MEMINDTDEDNYKQQNHLCFKRLCSNFNKKAVSKAKNVGQLLQQANSGVCGMCGIGKTTLLITSLMRQRSLIELKIGRSNASLDELKNLSHLTALETLYVKRSNASLDDELKNLSHLTTLETPYVKRCVSLKARKDCENTFILEKETEAADNKTPEESIQRTSLKFSRCISTERLLRGLETFFY